MQSTTVCMYVCMREEFLKREGLLFSDFEEIRLARMLEYHQTGNLIVRCLSEIYTSYRMSLIRRNHAEARAS